MTRIKRIRADQISINPHDPRHPRSILLFCMSEQFDISVVISTYNRCDLLPGALDSVLAQEAEGVRYEVIVVDNNSTDRTREVVESFQARGHRHLRYVFEGRQGLAYGWNAGITHARAPIIAFTDDDLWVAPDWVAHIKRALDEHPEVDYVAGKVLPRWPVEPPAWLTREHWAPLALADYGDEPFDAHAGHQVCLLGRSFRRSVFDRVGMFAPRFQRVKGGIGSMEDHEIQRRIWRAGGRGCYRPEIIVTTEVQAERLTKSYHRRWHAGHGRYYAALREEEFEQSRGRLFDIPIHLFRQAAADVAGWLRHQLRGDADRAFGDETRLCFFIGFARQRGKDCLATGGHSFFTEVAALLGSALGRKRGRQASKEVG